MAQDKKSTTESDEKTIQLSCFFLGGNLCGIDIARVQEINEDLLVSKAPLAPEYIVGIMNLRGQIVTVVDLKKKIGLEEDPEHEDQRLHENSEEENDTDNTKRIVIVVSRGENIGLLVDRVTEVMTVMTSQISEPPPNIRGAQGKYFKGVIQTGDHHLLAVLDVDAVLTEDDTRGSRETGQRS